MQVNQAFYGVPFIDPARGHARGAHVRPGGRALEHDGVKDKVDGVLAGGPSLAGEALDGAAKLGKRRLRLYATRVAFGTKVVAGEEEITVLTIEDATGEGDSKGNADGGRQSRGQRAVRVVRQARQRPGLGGAEPVDLASLRGPLSPCARRASHDRRARMCDGGQPARAEPAAREPLGAARAAARRAHRARGPDDARPAPYPGDALARGVLVRGGLRAGRGRAAVCRAPESVSEVVARERCCHSALFEGTLPETRGLIGAGGGCAAAGARAPRAGGAGAGDGA